MLLGRRESRALLSAGQLRTHFCHRSHALPMKMLTLMNLRQQRQCDT